MRSGQDLSHLIERDLDGEARAKVRLEALGCSVSLVFAESYGIDIMGELHAADGGRKLASDIEIQVAVYDLAGRIITMESTRQSGPNFDFGDHDMFKVHLSVGTGVEISRVRVLCARR